MATDGICVVGTNKGMYVKVVQLLEITHYTKMAVAKEESQKLLKMDIQCQYKISGQRNM